VLARGKPHAQKQTCLSNEHPLENNRDPACSRQDHPANKQLCGQNHHGPLGRASARSKGEIHRIDKAIQLAIT